MRVEHPDRAIADLCAAQHGLVATREATAASVLTKAELLADMRPSEGPDTRARMATIEWLDEIGRAHV